MAQAKGTKKGGAKAAKKNSKKQAAKKAAAKKGGGERKFSQTDAVEATLKRMKRGTPNQITEKAVAQHADVFAKTGNPGASIRAILQRTGRFRSVAEVGEDGKRTAFWEVIPEAERQSAAERRAEGEGEQPAAEPAEKPKRGRAKKAQTEPAGEGEKPKRGRRKAQAAAVADEAGGNAESGETAAPAPKKRGGGRKKKAQTEPAAEEVVAPAEVTETAGEPTVEVDEAAVAEADAAGE